MIKLRYTLSILFFVVALCPASNSLADTFPKCFIGSYLLEQGSGIMSLWTFGARGTLIVTSSSQKALSFSTEHGSWHKSAQKQAKSTMLDFSFGEDGELINIARIDATTNFNGNNCEEIEGEFTLRFFEPDQDPLNIESASGEPITDTFTGRRVNSE